MEDTVTCPKCDNESAYFDGQLYVCPDCDYEWPIKGISNKGDSLEDTIYEQAYKFLIKQPKPFFKLAHGQLYACKVQSEDDIRDDTIIPLAFEEGKNRLFIISAVEHIPSKHPQFLTEVTNKDFRTIKRASNQYGDYPSSYKAEPFMCTTDKDGTMINQFGELYSDFKLIQ